MKAQNIDHLFNNLTFQKNTAEIIAAAKGKITQLNSKIEERTNRIRTLRETYQISDSAFVDILSQMRENEKRHNFVQNYSTSTTDRSGVQREITVGAGVVNNLLTETDFIANERQQVERLTFIVSNLRDVQCFTANSGATYVAPHTLTFGELEYLGF
jgi:hypothetical protein